MKLVGSFSLICDSHDPYIEQASKEWQSQVVI